MTVLTVYRAAWVVPVSQPPIRDGWVAAYGGRIGAVGRGPTDLQGVSSQMRSEALGTMESPDDSPGGQYEQIDLGEVALVPGLVNAHTHLELAGLRGLVPPASSMPEWVRLLLRVRNSVSDSAKAAGEAIDEAVAFGTAALADITNSLVSVGPLGNGQTPAVVFHEVLGFDPQSAGGLAERARQRVSECALPRHVRLRLAPHAPYSTSAELIRAIAETASTSPWPPTSIHVAESNEEVRFLARGDGGWKTLLSDLGVPHTSWQPPGVSPAAFLDSLGVWTPGAMAVHGVHLTDAELEMLAGRDVTVVTCPRSNHWVAASTPPLARFVASGVRVALGTDSLASVPDLNLFEELKCLRAIAPDIPARTLLSWATSNGAKALALSEDLGTLARGQQARFLAIRVPRGLTDVEEALVSKVDATDIRWVTAESRILPGTSPEPSKDR